ncbi:hypothetical protein V6N12_001568 [Hibiscus sabdariffa]|uniref:Uncharacterized protein n=1 Tax=Hibiscus sabdariffa TaxID=183260 RepID=A0ABR1ZTW9_9ROSI
MSNMASSMASLALDDGEEELLQIDATSSLPVLYFANCLVDIVFHWGLSLRAPDHRPLPVNRWLRDENDDSSSGIKADGVNCGISSDLLAGNYGKNFRCDSAGDSSFPSKSPGLNSGRSNFNRDIQMGLSGEDTPMDQPECNKRGRTQEPVAVVSNRTDSIDNPISSLSTGLQERARRAQ